MGRRPTAIKNHFSLEISLSRTQETSLRPKNLPPRSHNSHQSAKKSCKKSSVPRQPAKVRTQSSQDTQQARAALGRCLRRRLGHSSSGKLWVWGCTADP